MRAFGEADLSLGLRLSAGAGWNQLDADWRRLLALGPGDGLVAAGASGPVGTAMATRFGRTAWVSMVLVDANARGKGVGTALMRAILGRLDDLGMTSIRLDATPQGESIYRRLGFEPGVALTRYRGSLRETAAASGPGLVDGSVRPATAADLSAVAAFDRGVTQTDRTALLRHLLDEPAVATWVASDAAGSLVGYAVARPGRTAWQIGPMLAHDERTGASLLAALAGKLAGEDVLIDVPDVHGPATDWVTAQGLTSERPLLRMTRGPAVTERVEQLWASSGPEKG